MDKKLSLYDVDRNARFQTLPTSTTSSQSAVIDADKIVLITNEAHFIAFGANPVATTSSFILPAGFPLQVAFTKGDKVAARTYNSNGNLTILAQ
jgi:GTP-binding protein EngB required for normal cell division